MTPHEKLFAELQDIGAIRALIGTTEHLHLDCKVWPKEDDQQRVLAKAFCGFRNAAGGVVVIGLRAKAGPGKEDPDLIEGEVLVADALSVKSRIETLVGQIVEPAIDGVRVSATSSGPHSAAGFVVVSIPPTDGFPCRSRKDWKFYLRIGGSTLPMEYFQIADMFGKRQRPSLRLYLEEANRDLRNGVTIRVIVFGIENYGRAVAKFPSIRFRPGLFQIDSYGIDGNYGFGLPQRPSEPGLIIFGGGVDQVIYPGTVLKVGKLEQTSRRSEWQPISSIQEQRVFDEFKLEVVLAAEEFASLSDSAIIPSREFL